MESSSSTTAPPRSGDAEVLLLRRLIAPLLRAGWSEMDSDLWYEEDLDEAVATTGTELERSGFHLRVFWDSATRELVLDDPTDSWDWTESLPPLCPLDTPLIINLTGHRSQAAQAETVRRAFATAGLLDATRIHLQGEAVSLHHDLILLLLADHVYGVAEHHRGQRDAGKVLASLGEEFAWRISSGLRTYPLIVPAPVPAVAAQGIAEWCWRRESDVEDWHHKVNDLTMARANIAATRAAIPHVHLEGVDWPAIRLALTLPNRRLSDGRALSDLFEDGWSPILDSIHRQLDHWQRAEDELGPQTVLRLLTLHGSHTESVGDWWGSGWYETLTRHAIHDAAQHDTLPPAVPRTFPDADHFADAAAQSPDTLDDDTFRWLTQAIFEEQSRMRAAKQPTPTAVTLPEWAIEQLTNLLTTSKTRRPRQPASLTFPSAGNGPTIR